MANVALKCPPPKKKRWLPVNRMDKPLPGHPRISTDLAISASVSLGATWRKTRPFPSRARLRQKLMDVVCMVSIDLARCRHLSHSATWRNDLKCRLLMAGLCWSIISSPKSSIHHWHTVHSLGPKKKSKEQASKSGISLTQCFS